MSYEGDVLSPSVIDTWERLTRESLEKCPGAMYEEHQLDLIATIRARDAKIAELQAKLNESHTLMPCRICDRGVRAKYAVLGMCAACAERELKRMRPVVNSLSSDPPEGATEGLRASADIVARTGAYSLAAWLNAIAAALEEYSRG